MAKTIKNLLNPTPGQIVYRNELWAKALEKNKKKTTGEMLCNVTKGRCCLRVAEDVAVKLGLELDSRDGAMPHPDVASFFGWTDKNPELALPSGEYKDAASINDDDQYKVKGSTAKSDGMPHRYIAECVRNTFCRPAWNYWTFETVG